MLKKEGGRSVSWNKKSTKDLHESLGLPTPESQIDLGPLYEKVKYEADSLDISPDALVRVVLREWLDARKTRAAN